MPGQLTPSAEKDGDEEEDGILQETGDNATE